LRIAPDARLGEDDPAEPEQPVLRSGDVANRRRWAWMNGAAKSVILMLSMKT
jgi:hypothetical protein